MMVFKIVSRCGLPRTIPVGPDIPTVGATFTIPANAGNGLQSIGVAKVSKLQAMRDTTEMVQMPVVFENSLLTTIPSNPQYGITEIYGGADIALSSTRFDGMTISFSGDCPPEYLTQGGTLVQFRMPEVSSITDAEGCYYVVLHATSSGGCHDFDLYFKVIPVEGEATGDGEISLFLNGNSLQVDFEGMEFEEQGDGTIHTYPWYLSIYRMSTNTRVHYSTNYVESKTVDISNWSPGIYLVSVDCNGHHYGKKFIIQ